MVYRCQALGNGTGRASRHSDNSLLSLLHSDMKSERRAPSPDVIVLSDNEQPASPRVNGLTKEALKETSTDALMVSLVPVLGGDPALHYPQMLLVMVGPVLPGYGSPLQPLFSCPCRKAVLKNEKE